MSSVLFIFFGTILSVCAVWVLNPYQFQKRLFSLFLQARLLYSDPKWKKLLTVMFPIFTNYSPKVAETDENETFDFEGTPLRYYKCSIGQFKSRWELTKALALITLTGLFATGDVVSVPLIFLRWCGIDIVDVAQQYGANIWTLLAFLAFSFAGACHGYHKHCLEIEQWTKAQESDDWKCQKKAKEVSDETYRLSVIIGSINAGSAAVYGTATSILRIHYGWTKMYWDVNDYGIVWYLLSWPIFLAWVELFAYSFHRFFHLKFVYKHFHKLHHRFQPPTAHSAVAFHPIEFACYVFGGQAIFFFVPIHPTVMIAVGLYTAYYLIEDHTGIQKTAPWPWQPTTFFHDDHHRYFHLNFGQHTLFYDYIFGTLRNGRASYGENTFGGKGIKSQ